MINNFDQMLLGAGMVPWGIGCAISCGRNCISGRFMCCAHYWSHFPRHTAEDRDTDSLSACPCLPTLAAGQPRSRPWGGQWNQAQNSSMTGFICRHRCLWSSAETHNILLAAAQKEQPPRAWWVLANPENMGQLKWSENAWVTKASSVNVYVGKNVKYFR